MQHRGPGQVAAHVPYPSLQICICPEGCGSASSNHQVSVCGYTIPKEKSLTQSGPQNLPIAKPGQRGKKAEAPTGLHGN